MSRSGGNVLARSGATAASAATSTAPTSASRSTTWSLPSVVNAEWTGVTMARTTEPKAALDTSVPAVDSTSGRRRHKVRNLARRLVDMMMPACREHVGIHADVIDVCRKS